MNCISLVSLGTSGGSYRVMNLPVSNGWGAGVCPEGLCPKEQLAICIINKQMHTGLRVHYPVLYLLLLYVSTPKHHPEGAVMCYLQRYINVFMQCWWCFFLRSFHIHCFELLKL
jgi:hypothetical protein